MTKTTDELYEENQLEIEKRANQLKHIDITDSYDKLAEMAISCCQLVSLSVNSGDVDTQTIIHHKVAIDQILRRLEGDIINDIDMDRDWLVKYVQRKIDSIMEAKQVWRI